ncbi:hypothetical protein [Mesobacillus selenatarsenatis]|uniref:Uncharacterized protein n=1 Tax=Mesobacillus selenatarsenatis (strain DSM 18680 / JCM 14380 / FERM P-15431 / SF-1) TaxID=1321606 RepID=A0A0A8XCA1_MESS1|nr:hypothetical protein [Mesobacillus selenatarsenatis]GAM16652.1 hypothetical protein SAMD00020551_4882 [Mesobacillus selenatarsenatis SF-1]
MKKDFKTSALVILIVITAIALLDNARTSKTTAELKENRDELIQKVATLEKEIEQRSSETDELKRDNDRLAVNLSDMEEEVTASQSSVRYQDFLDAVGVVEAYKAAGDFKEVTDLIALQNLSGYSTSDKEGNCPCSFTFKNSTLEWNPGVVLNLSEFNIEKGKIILTYLTVEDLEDDYQFVIVRGEGFFDLTEKWRIEDIRLIEKEGSEL